MESKEVKPDSDKNIADILLKKKQAEGKQEIKDSRLSKPETKPVHEHSENKSEPRFAEKPDGDVFATEYKIDWKKHKTVELIEIKIRKINQLFNSFDPSPFLEKDLDQDAFEYIVSAVGEHHLKVKQKIVIYMPKFEKRKVSEAEITKAIHHYFEYKKILAERSIKLKLQEGQVSLIIGIVFLGSCLILRELITSSYDNLFMNILGEGLIIGGWVAMWKPISNILYDWWPLRKEKNIFEKISKMEVDFVYT
jgi:hypothetical protein